MLKKEQLEKLESSLGLKAGEFKALFEDPTEKEIAIDTLEIIPKADYATRIANIEKAKYDEGKLAGTEIVKKEIRAEFGIDVSKKIEIPELKAAITTKVLDEAKIAPDARVKQLETDLGVMTTNYQTAQKEKNEVETGFKQKEKLRTINQNIISLLPEKTLIPREDVAELALRKAAVDGITPDISDTGAVIFRKGDTIMKDINLVELKADAVLKNYYTTYVAPATGGDGGGDNAGNQNKPGTLAAFCEEMAGKNIKEGSAKFNEEMNARLTNKTLTI